MTLMTDVARKLHDFGMILRSGGAGGADTAFESGVTMPERKIIYLPWKGFNGRYEEEGSVFEYSDRHVEIATAAHRSWGHLDQWGKAMHTRNVAQVLGGDCSTPSNFVICWTPRGETKGGTATAIKIASENRIVVFNLFNRRAHDAMVEFVSTGNFDEEAWAIL